MHLKEIIASGIKTVSASYPPEEAREMVFAYMEHAAGTKRYTHIIEPSREVSDDICRDAFAAFDRMAAGEPLQYVTGQAFFYGRAFRVTPDVLIPRPETELLCQRALRILEDSHPSAEVLDLCTGSGCIAWTMALEAPGTMVSAVDLSEGALDVASSQNLSEEAARTGACSPHFIKGDVLAPDFPASLQGQFDLILSNPPYVMDSEKALMRRNVLDHEPSMALFVPDDDPVIFYRSIAACASRLLKPDGVCIVEINEALADETAEVFRHAGFRSVTVIRDLNSKDRFLEISGREGS